MTKFVPRVRLALLLFLTLALAEHGGAPVRAQQICPCSIWSATATVGPVVAEAGQAELGVKFQTDTSGYITGLRFYKYAQNTGAHVGNLWTSGGTRLGTVTFTNETASGWQQASFATPIPVSASTTYIASYHTDTGYPAATANGFASAVDNSPLHAPSSSASGGNGVYIYSSASAFPNQTWNASNYWVDVAFVANLPADTTPPIVSTVTPAGGATGVAAAASVTATFNEAMAAGSVTSATVTLRDPSNAVVAATVSYDPSTLTATLTPGLSLAPGATYTASVKGGPSGVTDLAGNPLAADFAWSFTIAVPAVCPCSIWGGSTTPGPMANEAGQAELGVKFRSDSAGVISGLRFYKYALNTGTHVGNLWTAGGTLLGSVTFTNESTSGWQQMNFPSPIAIAANTTYVASYHLNAGYPAVTQNGLAASVDNPPLHALASGASGGNGVFVYGATSAFPNQTWNAGNYWVDVVFAPADTTPPTVTARTPASGATGVSSATTVTATFNEALLASSVTTATILLKDAANTLVPATVSYNPSTFTATLTPTAPLANAAVYTATVKGGSSGVRDAANNALAADVVWSFTTAAETTPPTIAAVTPAGGATGVPRSTVVTVTFSEAMSASTINTTTVALRSGAASVPALVSYNAATFTATLTPASPLAYVTTYTATVTGGASGVKDLAGNALAADSSWSFTTEGDTTPPTIASAVPASGATGVPLSTSVTVAFSEAMTASTINTTTVGLRNGATSVAASVSYNATTFTATLTPTAALSYATTYTATVTGGSPGVKDLAGNALAATASWSFTTVTDATPPTIVSVTPAAGATGVATATTVTVTFSEAMLATSVTNASVLLKDATSASVPATVSYDAATLTATLTPSSPLAYAASYTATVKGGAGGVADVAGNVLVADVTWTFQTVAAPFACPCTIWPSTATVGPMDAQVGSVELGVKFRSDVGGYISGIRFYKYSLNTGTHVGNLWSSTGTLLATATFTNETSSGWQQVSFASPVAIAANTTYVASYHTNAGKYAATSSGLASAVDRSPLHALASASSGGNGVYGPGSTSIFPTQTYNATNYWVDVVLTLTLPDTTRPTVVATAPAAAATGVNPLATVTATFSEAMTASSVTSSTVTLKAGSTSIAAAVGYDAATFTATLTPTSPLAYSTLYTATVKSGSSGVKDLAGNALATDYTWSFTTAPDTSGPTVTGVTPAAGATQVPINLPVTVTFSEAMAAASVNTGVTLRDAAGALVPATVTYDPATWTATLTPTAWLAKGAVHTATVSGVTDALGNPIAAPFLWSFTTQASGCPCSLWTLSTTPGPMASDMGAGELGVKFRSDVAGSISGLRFYKYAANTGTHVGNLWSAAGTLLGTVTFSNESSSGWQQAMFASPIAISANTTYVASYHTNTGFYAATTSGLTTAVDNAPLHAPASGASGGNGVYSIGTTSTFPNLTWNASNYWVDVVLTTSGADTTPPWVTGTSPASASMGNSTATTVAATFSEPIDSTTVSASTFELRTASGALVSATIAYNAATWTATLTPSSALAAGSTYTATVKTGIEDAPGNALTTPVAWTFTTAPATPAPNQGAGGPVLVITNPSNPFTQYYAEILRAEGLTEFAVRDLSTVTTTVLSGYDVVLLGEQALTTTQTTMLTNWVQGGGNLIAFRPDKKLAALLGLTSQSATLADAYLAIDTSQAPGTGLVSQTIQFHGTADEYVLAGARGVATLYSDATHATAFPAVTLAGAGTGQAAAFTYDLAKSIVYTRQGNPAWAGQERDGTSPIRSDDLFFGAKTGDVKPDWVDLTRVAIPQADEQQRLLVNLMLLMNSAKRPLPRFWYLPDGRKAVVVLTADDHASGGVGTRFTRLVTQSPNACRVDRWECLRSTAYMKSTEAITDAQVASYVAQGFEVAAHVTMDPGTQFGCGADFTASTLANAYTTELTQFAAAFPSAPAPKTHRMHCVTWSDWSTQPQTELLNGIRLDTSYYYWPGTWFLDEPGMFTGSGMPMRYATSTGAPIDVYQATTQMTDESSQTYPLHIDTLLDNAIGASGYYGVFTANIHTDSTTSQPISDAIVSSAQTRGVAVVSAKQMLDWLDGRNGSTLTGISWADNALTFSALAGSRATGLQVMVPAQVGTLHLTGITLNSAPVTYTVQTIKGVSYAFVTVAAGQYRASYAF